LTLIQNFWFCITNVWDNWKADRPLSGPVMGKPTLNVGVKTPQIFASAHRTVPAVIWPMQNL
jgi:hypothetical protein